MWIRTYQIPNTFTSCTSQICSNPVHHRDLKWPATIHKIIWIQKCTINNSFETEIDIYHLPPSSTHLDFPHPQTSFQQSQVACTKGDTDFHYWVNSSIWLTLSEHGCCNFLFMLKNGHGNTKRHPNEFSKFQVYSSHFRFLSKNYSNSW